MTYTTTYSLLILTSLIFMSQQSLKKLNVRQIRCERCGKTNEEVLRKSTKHLKLLNFDCWWTITAKLRRKENKGDCGRNAWMITESVLCFLCFTNLFNNNNNTSLSVMTSISLYVDRTIQARSCFFLCQSTRHATLTVVELQTHISCSSVNVHEPRSLFVWLSSHK